MTDALCCFGAGDRETSVVLEAFEATEVTWQLKAHVVGALPLPPLQLNALRYGAILNPSAGRCICVRPAAL